jgi:hypothetical protein
MKMHLPRIASMVWHFALVLLASALSSRAADSTVASPPQPPDKALQTQAAQAHKLLQAVLIGTDSEGIQKLLDGGIDINARAEAGVTAYHVARLLGELELAQYLAGHGADTNIPIPAPDKLLDALFTHVYSESGFGRLRCDRRELRLWTGYYDRDARR